MNRIAFTCMAAGALALTATRPAVAAPAPQGGSTIAEIAAQSGRFDTLVSLLAATGLSDPLSQPGTYTVFAPTDEAFEKLPAETLQYLAANPDVLTDVLLYHVAGEELPAASVLATTFIDTLNGQRLDVALQGGLPFVDQSQILVTDILASNGVVHVIDTVLLPSFSNVLRTAVAAGDFTTLAAALKAGGLVEALQGEGPFTVFAPTDAAFAKLPPGTLASLLDPANKQQLSDILLYHVVADRVFSDQVLLMPTATTLLGEQVRFVQRPGGLFVNTSKIELADIDASNGVIHVIDTVLLPPSN